MRTLRRSVLPCLVTLVALAVVSGGAGATDWPATFDYTIGVATQHGAGLQLSGLLAGPIAPDMSLKFGGWWITRSTNNRSFVGDAYVDYTKDPLYLAVGRKYVPFGPAQLLVSPGITGAEAKLSYERVEVQAMAGNISFTPLTGVTRFTFGGALSPSDEDLVAARVQVLVTSPGADNPVKVGVNYLDVMDDTGSSADISIGVNDWLTLYGESAEYDDLKAHVWGFMISDEKTRGPGNRPTIIQIYHRKVPVCFVPAMVGASAYFEGQEGWAGGIYQGISDNYAIGLFADSNDAILTLFGHVDLQ